MQAYLESFYKFCTLLGGTTADAMCPILEVSARPPSFLPAGPLGKTGLREALPTDWLLPSSPLCPRLCSGPTV